MLGHAFALLKRGNEKRGTSRLTRICPIPGQHATRIWGSAKTTTRFENTSNTLDGPNPPTLAGLLVDVPMVRYSADLELN
ncbi:unnamed protein product [Toxocara canis]|uniref:Uncharacterized protein n=1 Tax=Toxocara canis TaxID=6265 RepID=A0A183U2Z9_TOXCA|nr:unnamed protein product [Toxocara canis]